MHFVLSGKKVDRYFLKVQYFVFIIGFFVFSFFAVTRSFPTSLHLFRTVYALRLLIPAIAPSLA